MKLKIYILLFVIIFVVSLAGYYFMKNLNQDPFEELTEGGPTEKKTLIIEEGKVIDMVTPEVADEVIIEKQSEKIGVFETKEIFVTNGVKHSVPLNEILGGGPAKDGIPSIDNPKFISINEASKDLDDQEIGLGITIDGVSRFYPFQILVFHEIVNDKINEKRILVTYCPLCFSGIVFDPVVEGERVEFGTSGKLWQSNLVMYDRKSDSYWSQILGEAIVGEMTGTKLKVLESDIVRFGEWKRANPDGEVLSRDTGATRFYGRDPYGDYYTTPGTIFPVRETDNRLEDKDFILGIVIGEKAKAYLPEAIKRVGELEDDFGGKKIIVKYEEDLDVVRLFEKKADGSLERINPFPNFWFSWVAAHPNTELYK